MRLIIYCSLSGSWQTRLGNQNPALAVQAVRTVRGNSFCIDCEAPSEYKASRAGSWGSGFKWQQEGDSLQRRWPSKVTPSLGATCCIFLPLPT